MKETHAEVRQLLSAQNLQLKKEKQELLNTLQDMVDVCADTNPHIHIIIEKAKALIHKTLAS